MKRLTEIAGWRHNWPGTILSKTAIGKIGSGATGLALIGAVMAPGSVDAQDSTVPAANEHPALVAIIEGYRKCVAEAAAVTTPALIADPAVREVAFNTLIEGCDEIRDGELAILDANARSAAADADMDAITDGIIRGAKAEIGLKS